MLETHFTGTNNQTSKQKDFSKQEERNQKMEEAEVGRKLGEGLVGSNNYRILSSKEKEGGGKTQIENNDGERNMNVFLFV